MLDAASPRREQPLGLALRDLLAAEPRPLRKAIEWRADPGEDASAGGKTAVRARALVDSLDAVARRAALGEAMRAFHRGHDLLLTPTLPLPAFAAGSETPAGEGQGRWPDWTPFSYPFNLTQQPACSVPCGFTGDGLPVGLQIVANNFREDLVLRAAYAFEKRLGLSRRPAL